MAASSGVAIFFLPLNNEIQSAIAYVIRYIKQ